MPNSVGAARQIIAALLPPEMLEHERGDDVILAVSEAVTNAVRHAYDDPGGRIHVSARRSVDQLLITVSDHGRGLGSPSPAPGLGLGMGLIETVADRAVFRANRAGGTTVEMRFDLVF